MRRTSVLGIIVALATAVVVWRLACRSSDSTGGDEPSGGGAGVTDPSGTRKGGSARGARAQPASLSGRVTKLEGGAGIAGAVVAIATADLGAMFSLGNEPTTIAITDANGAWSVPSIAPSTYHVSASAVGFVPKTREKLVVAAGAKETLDLQLAEGGTTISGTVSDVGGGPIGGARVTAHGSNRVLAAPAEIVAMTGPDGTYKLTLADGSYTAKATHDDYTGVEEGFQLQGEPLTIDFALVPGGQIRGQVVTRDGTPVPHAMVTAASGRARNDPDGGHPTFTDDAGNFAIRSLDSGAVSLRAIARGYSSAQPTVVEVGIGEHVDGVRVVVDKALSISGRVVKTGKPAEGIPGVRLGVFTLTGQAAFALDPSAEDGSFEILGVQPASYMMFAFGEDIMPELGRQVEVVDKDVTGLVVEMSTGVVISGRIDPPAVAQLSLDPASERVGIDNMFAMVKVAMVRGTSEPTGEFELRAVPNGSFSLHARTAEGDVGKLAIEVADKDLTGLVVKLEKRASIAGKVVDDRGAPMAGMRVLASKSSRDADQMVTFGDRRESSAITSANGSFKIVGVDPGKYAVHAFDDDDFGARLRGRTDKRRQTVEVAANEAVTGITITLEARDGVIRGSVVDRANAPVTDAWVTATLLRTDDVKVTGVPYGSEKSVLTKADGTFAFEQLQRGTYRIDVEGPRGASRGTKAEVKTGDTVTITVEPLGTLSGRVTLGGTPVAAYDLACAPKERPPSGDTASRRFTNADGSYLLERLSPGEYTCNVKADRGHARGMVVVASGPAKLDLALAGFATITGVVVGAADGKPVPNLAVAVSGEAGFEDSLAQMVTGKGITTDASGRFVVERVAAGKVELHVLSKSDAFKELAKQEHTVTAGQRLDVGTIKVVTPRGDDAGTLGFSTSIDDDKLLVGVVKEDGPGAKAGVVEGDRIVSIDGKPVAQLGAETAQKLIAAGSVAIGQRVQLGLERDGKPAGVTVTAVKW